MKNIAVYPGTFDPVTYGHVDLVERAARIFDEVIVAIAVNENKRPLFSLAEREALASTVFSGHKNVKVLGFSGLLLEFAKQQHAKVILRGLRTVTDFDYEFQLASMNRFLDPAIESIFMMPAEKFMNISSSLIREIAALNGDVSGFVSPQVAAALKKKFASKVG
jgi:pantetheine-phosphate adenylyltransferase